jgi:hypothetical protein
MTIGAMPNFFWYDNPDEGIRIKYPSDWRVIEAHLAKDDIVKFYSPERAVVNGNSTAPTAGVFVKVVPSDGTNLDALASQQIEGTENTRTLGISLIELGDLPGYEIVLYNYLNPDRIFKIMSDITIKNGQIYSINFVADPSKYDDYVPLAREMMKSFQFTE